MSKLGKRLIEAAKQARAIAKRCDWPECRCERKCQIAEKMGEVVRFKPRAPKPSP